MRTFGMLLLGVLTALPAIAQTPDTLAWRRYFPLAIGNVWEFEVWDRFSRNDASGDLTGYQRYRLVRDTVVDGRAGFVVLEEAYWPSYPPALMGAGVSAIGYVGGKMWTAPENNSWDFAAEIDSTATGERPCYSRSYVDQNQARISEEYCFAPDRGPVYHRFTSDHRYGYSATWSTLIYAKTNGQVWGTPVASGDEARPEAVALRLWPNPSRGAVTVEASPRVSVVAFDLLGREAVRTTAGPDGRAALTLVPGVYVVAAGSQRQTLVVR